MKQFITLFLIALSLSGFSQTYTLECLKNEMVDKRGNCSTCPNTDELFTGIRITRPTGVKQKLYSPIKAKLYSDSTYVNLTDAYGNSASIRISQIDDYDTFTTLITFLTDCSLVDSVSGGGGGGSDSLYIKTTSVADEVTTYKVMLDNGTTKDSIIVEDSHPQLTVTTATVDDLRTYSIKQNGTTKGTITVNLEAVDTSHVAQMISDSMAALGGGGGISKTANDTVFTYSTVWKDGSNEIKIENNRLTLNDGTNTLFLQANSAYFGNGADNNGNYASDNAYLYNQADESKIDLYSNHMTIDRAGYSATGATEVPILSEVKQLISDSLATVGGGSSDSSYLWRHRAYMMGGASTLSGDGLPYTGTGTNGVQTVSISSTYKGRSYPATTYVATAASNAVAGVRHSANTVHMGQYGGGGFEVIARTTLKSTTNIGINKRFFMGLNGNSNAAPTDVNPSSKANILGIGWDATDATIQIFHNDGSGTATKVNTGIDIPDEGEEDVYYVRLYCVPGGTSVKITAGRVELNSYYTTTVSSDIPSVSTLMYFDCYASAGGVSDDAGVFFIDAVTYSK